MIALHLAVRGRARCRVQGLYRAEGVKAAIEAELRLQPGIRSVSANVLTANVLILFDPERPVEDVLAALERVLVNAGSVPARRAPAATKDGTVIPLRARRAGTEAAERAWHALDGTVVLARVGGTWQGLSVAAAAERLRRSGPNVLPEAEPRSGLAIFLSQFASLPVALLGASAAVSIVTGGLADAAVILGVVLINAVIGYVTESQAERTINALTHAVEPNVLVRRDGRLGSLPVRDLVVGDLLVLAPGTFVGADARLLEAQHLTVDESSLTGESLPVLKSTRLLEGADVPLGERANMVYRGARVSGGQGLAVVVATGPATELGHIQRLMKEAEPPESPMERQLRRLGNQMVWVAGGVCGAVFVAGLLRGYGLAQMLKTSISLAVAAVPEGLPTVATTTLALGLRRMHRRKVLIRHLDAVETLGSVQVLCLDKTGTLTENRMAVVALHVGGERLTFRDGRFRRGAERVDPYGLDELLRLLHVAVLCNESEVDGERGGYVMNGSATENALVEMALSAGVDVLALRRRHPRLSVNYRAEHRLYMSTVHEMAPGSLLLAVKGSPAEVLRLSRWVVVNGERRPLGDAEREAILAANESMAGEALRVLGVAYATIDGPAAASEEDGLIWLGLVGLADPLRAGAPELIGQFHDAGIETVMITGDQSATAYAIGRELRLSGNDHLDILDSTHLETLDPEVLKSLAGRVHVFARVSPAHKLKIVQALQRAGKIVGMTGDGINDGPALRAADIGVAMGAAGTDVARQVADVVLEDDDLQTLIVAVSEGRTIYHNIRKSVHFLLATNLSEILVMFSAVAAGMGQPLNPMQLLWINLVTDIFPAIGLALEPPEPDVLRRPPRDPGEPIVRPRDLKRIGFEAVTISAGCLAAYGYGIARYGTGPGAGTIAFASLTGAQLLHAMSSRSEHHSVFDRGQLPANPALYAALGGTAALSLGALFAPGLRRFLGSAPLAPLDLAVSAAGAAVPFLVNETTKSLESAR